MKSEIPSELDVDALLALSPGPELDAAVAKHVLGCQVAAGLDGAPVCGCPRPEGMIPHGDPRAGHPHKPDVRPYSSDWEALGQLAEALADRGWGLTLQHGVHRPGWFASLCRERRGAVGSVRDRLREFAESAPLAACYVALQAMSIEADERLGDGRQAVLEGTGEVIDA